MPNGALNSDERAGTTVNGKPSLTIDQAAVKLTGGEGGWGTLGQPTVVTYAFRATAPSAMPDDISGFAQFSAAQIAAAEKALKLWSDVANISFVRVGSGTSGSAAYSDNATILFGDYANGKPNVAAFTYLPGDTSPASRSGDIWVSTAVSSNVGVSADGGEGFATLLHEIGHAIGLDHPSDYARADQADFSYARDASYAEDSREYTVMSYFDLADSGGRRFPYGAADAPRTPLIDDIAAAQFEYGANLSTNSGNTVYGYRGSQFLVNGAQLADDHLTYSGVGASTAYSLWGTIWDGGGIDTIDLSSAPAAVRIDLRPGSFSDIGMDVGMFSIAQNVIIENAVGSSGYDSITGNDVANILMGGGGTDTISGGGGDDQIYGGDAGDMLTGGPGADTFIGTQADIFGDTITDFGPGDRIRITDANLASFSFDLNGTNLRIGQSLMFLSGLPAGARLVASAAPGGGVDLMLASGEASGAGPGASPTVQKARSDFNGDGRSDILWRNDGGLFSDWLGRADGGFAANDSYARRSITPDWQVVGTGDFNGDGRADVLWRHNGGALTDWLGQASGAFVANDAAAMRQVSADWHVAGTGDFNGDGRADIVWRSDAGGMSDWLGQANGSFAGNDAVAYRTVATDWHIVGAGDFNGDGRSDLLWRNDAGGLSDWLGSANGGFVGNDANAFAQVSTDWHIVGTGDFNGDGRSDILWRNNDGTFSDWLGLANGGFTGNDANALRAVSTDWQIVATGDFNGDGRDDIVWRSASGALSDWLGLANGAFTGNDANALAQVDTSWHVVPQTFLV